MNMTKNINKVLPMDIVSDILTRLPTDSVLESKLVCKTWNNLTQHPSFPKMHLARLNHPDSTGKLGYVFAIADDDVDDYDFNIKCLYYFEYNENEDWKYVKPIRRKISVRTTCEAYILIGSFNGLFCIYGTRPSSCDAFGPAMIINPVTREYTVLPELDNYPEYDTKGSNSIRYDHLACGFGYLAETNEYKVVRIYKCYREPNVVEVDVYTLGSGKGWRNVGKFEFGFTFYTHCYHIHGVFLNGCIHWRNTEGGHVVVFDLADEKFREHIPPPPLLTGTDDDADTDGFIVIGVSGGGVLYYAVCQFINGEDFGDVWLLTKKNEYHITKDHEKKQSWGWTKSINLQQSEPFAFMERGNVLRYDHGNMKVCFSENADWTNFGDFTEICRQVFPHKHTLVSLKELGEENAEIMESCGIDEESDSSESGSA